jgi:hypothetical protein
MASRTVMSYLRKSTGADEDRLKSPARTSGAASVLVLAFGLLLLAHDRRPHTTPIAPNECTTDPRNILFPGELVDRQTLNFIIAAHCTRAKLRPDGWIELRYEGKPFGVETTRFDIAQDTFYEILWVGGMLSP